MKSLKTGPCGGGFKAFSDGVWQVFVLLLLAFTLLFYATEVQAAQISFNPHDVRVTAAPGDTIEVPVSISLLETSLPNAYARFGLAYVTGTIDRSWIKNQVYVSLNSRLKTSQAVLLFRIPANARGGHYHGVLKTVGLRTNERITPVALNINLEVDSYVSCSQVPLFSEIVYSTGSIRARNNKEVFVQLSGTVNAPEVCQIENPRYQLVDEYGELSRTEAIQVDVDGHFKVDIPMVAYRKGNDKDGRFYTLKFLADNEAGIGVSTETVIVVEHDNRKK